jgi:hypothetical protein
MPQDFNERLYEYRAETCRTRPGFHLTTQQGAVEFVNERGFVTFWPVQGLPVVSLWSAVAGDRPVPDDHDDPAHITWGWKDDLISKKVWYYGRVLARRNAMISLECLPFFYALSPNYGDYENDYLEEYERGEMTAEAKSIYEALLKDGPLDTLLLRKAARMTSTASESRFKRALDDLQEEFKVLPTGISPSGAWHYAFIYDITPRYYPELVEQTRWISESSARKTLLQKYLLSMGAVSFANISRLFRWKKDEIQTTIAQLAQTEFLISNFTFPNTNISGVVLKDLALF